MVHRKSPNHSDRSEAYTNKPLLSPNSPVVSEELVSLHPGSAVPLIEVDIDQVVISNRYRKDLGDLATLARSIEDLGLLQPIGITKDFTLVFGERRLRACQKILKRTTILARVLDINSIIAGEHAENELHKAFTPSERVAIATALEAEIPERRGNPSIRKNLDELKGRTADIVARRSGFGNHQTLRDAKRVVERGSRKLIEAMDTDKVAISTAAILLKAPLEVQDKLLNLSSREISQKARAMRHRKEAASMPHFVGEKQQKPAFHETGANWTLTNSLQPISCQLLVVAPPFGSDKEAWQPNELAAFTNEWGSRWSCCGARHIAVLWRQDYLFEGKDWLDESFGGYRLEQILTWQLTSPEPAECRKRFVTSWQPIYLYRQAGNKTSPRYATERQLDCHVAENTRESDALYQQLASRTAPLPRSLVYWLLAGLTSEADAVATLFCDTVICGIASTEMNRRYHGSQFDVNQLTTAAGHLRSLSQRTCGTETINPARMT